MKRRSGLALFVLPFAIAGCGGSGSGTDDDPGKPDGKATPTAAAALSEDEYQALVDDGSKAVKESLDEIRGASSRSGLQKRLQQSAETVDSAASGLTSAKAPESAAASHSGTVTALQGLSTEIASAQAKVESGELCTSPAVVAHLTRSSAGSDLRSAAKGLREAGLKAGSLGPKQQKMPALRLKSGAMLSRKGGTGPNVLIIKNGNPREGVVKLRGGDKRMSIFIGKKASATINGIPDGNFEVYFASGTSWDGKRNSFSRNCGFTKFERKMKFTSGGGQYTEFRITLNQVKGGNAPTTQIDPDDFPKD